MKTFLVYNTSYFGDTILTDALCRNLKRLYPESRLVFVSNKPFTDISRYMDGVDEVWTYDNGASIRDLPDGINFIKNIKTNMFLMPLLSFTAMSGAFYYPNF